MPLTALFAPLILSVGLGSTPTPAGLASAARPAPAAAQEREYQDREEASGAAIEAVRQGNLERAREILGMVLVTEYLDRARALFDAAEPASGLPLIDRALDIEPRSTEALGLRAEGLLQLGEQTIANGQGGYALGFFEDAERTFERAGTSPFSLFGRARAAYLQNRAEDARRFALEAAALLRDVGAIEATAPDAGTDAIGVVDPPAALLAEYRFGKAQRILADACYLAYAEIAQAMYDQTPEADAALEQQRFEEALAECDALIGVAGEDPTTWTLLANLHLYRATARDDATENRAAIRALELGLERTPDDPLLLARLISTARSTGGTELAAEVLERYVERTPGTLAGRQALAAERFEQALVAIPADLADAEGFRANRSRFEACEASFREVLADAPEDSPEAQSSPGWIVVSRTGQGWMDYWAGDLEPAEQTFVSTEEIVPGGAQWTYGDRLRSAVRGLQGLVGKHSERGELTAACRVSDHLVELLPEDATMWNDAGFFHRDLATSIEFTARQLCRAAAGEEQQPDRLEELRDAAQVAPELYGTEAEKRIFREQSEALLTRARAEMERSRDAYERAVELAPDDVIVLNDSALIYVYYLHTDLELAEQRFLRAIERGEALLADPDLPQEERDLLTVPYGDAHENLGVLYIEHRADSERARMYFEKAVEIGPGPRPIVTDYYLPICDGSDPGGFAAFERDVLGWAAPCR